MEVEDIDNQQAEAGGKDIQLLSYHHSSRYHIVIVALAFQVVTIIITEATVG